MKMKLVPLIQVVPVARVSSRGIGVMSHGRWRVQSSSKEHRVPIGLRVAVSCRCRGVRRRETGEVRFPAAGQSSVQADITCPIQLVVPAYVHIRHTTAALRTANREQRILRLCWIRLTSQCFLLFTPCFTPILRPSVHSARHNAFVLAHCSMRMSGLARCSTLSSTLRVGMLASHSQCPDATLDSLIGRI